MDIHVSIDSYVLAGDDYGHSLVSLNDCGYRDIPPDILDTTQMKYHEDGMIKSSLRAVWVPHGSTSKSTVKFRLLGGFFCSINE